MGTITVREVDENLWRTFKSTVISEDITVGEGLNLAINNWLHTARKKKGGKSFFDAAPIAFVGDDVEHLSERVDEVLY